MGLSGFDEVEGVELLQRIPLFSRLTFEETNRLASIIQRQPAAEGTVVVEQDALGDALWIVLEGEVRVTRSLDVDRAGEELGRLGVGQLFGEMSLVDDLLTSARVTALSSCTLLKLPRAEFQRVLAGDDKLALKVYQSFCRTLSDRLRRSNQGAAAGLALSLR